MPPVSAGGGSRPVIMRPDRGLAASPRVRRDVDVRLERPRRRERARAQAPPPTARLLAQTRLRESP